MTDALPLVPISHDNLSYLLAAMLVYQQYRKKKTPPSVERAHTLLVLEALLPRLYLGTSVQEGSLPLLLTVDDVQVLKSGLTTLLDHMNRRPASRARAKEVARLKELKTLLDQHFPATQ